MDEQNYHTDEALAALARTETRYFGVLVRRYERKLGAYVRRLGGLSPEDVDDILQETFLKAYRNLNGFDPALRFSSWLYRIAHNETMSFFRARRARPHGHLVRDSEDALTALAGELDVLADALRADDARALTRGLEKLSEEYRDVLVLRFFEHKSYDEISDILALPPGTVATRISRAKTQLQKHLGSNGYLYA